VLSNYFFHGGSPPNCPPANPPLSPPLDTSTYVELINNVFPAGESSWEVQLNFANSRMLTAIDLPLRIRVGGENPGTLNIDASESEILKEEYFDGVR
jgi:hypothetical protein